MIRWRYYLLATLIFMFSFLAIAIPPLVVMITFTDGSVYCCTYNDAADEAGWRGVGNEGLSISC